MQVFYYFMLSSFEFLGGFNLKLSKIEKPIFELKLTFFSAAILFGMF